MHCRVCNTCAKIKAEGNVARKLVDNAKGVHMVIKECNKGDGCRHKRHLCERNCNGGTTGGGVLTDDMRRGKRDGKIMTYGSRLPSRMHRVLVVLGRSVGVGGRAPFWVFTGGNDPRHTLILSLGVHSSHRLSALDTLLTCIAECATRAPTPLCRRTLMHKKRVNRIGE